ncbi:MAG: hypothetical protein Q7S22_02100 [Candidatus Micrarchaeota archaeon]|nr:hypothetical protein [Candidatus Micrarchaeota archaeon]
MLIRNHRLILLSLLLVLLLAGCTSEEVIKQNKSEQIIQSDVVKIDNTDVFDHSTYSFSPISLGSGIIVRRTISVSSEPSVSLVSEQELTDSDVIQIDNHFSDFMRDYEDSISSCLKNIGVKSVSCADATTCLKLCTSNSVKCKNSAQLYGDSVSNSILSYVNDVNEIRDISSDIRRDTPNLMSISSTRKGNFVSSIYKIMGKISSLNSNPLISQKELGLCEPVSYDASKLINITDQIGTTKVSDGSYRYRVTLFVDFGDLEKNEKLKYSDITLSDALSDSIELEADSLSVSQPSTVESNRSTLLSWQGIRPASKPKTIIFYSFNSKQSPEEISSKFNAPSANIKTFNFAFLVPVVSLYNLLKSVTNNFSLSFALSFSMTIIIFMVFMTILNLIYNLIRASISKESTSTWVRRALGRTGVKWKSDILFGIILVIIGFVSLNTFVPVIVKIPEFFAAPDLLINEPAILVPVLSFLFGFILIYLALDNKIKVSVLESIYGKELREDKDMFGARVTQLKVMLAELKKLIEEYSKENFDVGQEYDVLSSISVEKIDEYVKKADNSSRKIVDDELTKVEEAIERLHERKNQTEQNWDKWKDTIYRILDENGEVHPNNLLIIPASLRSWALQRFLKEYGNTGVVMEGNLLKRKEVTLDMSVKQMVDKKLLIGAVVSKNGKIVATKISKGNSTLIGALTVKLLNYLKSVPRELGQHELTSLATIGEKYVLVLVKQGTTDSLLIIEKEKFKEAMDEWKSKMKSV